MTSTSKIIFGVLGAVAAGIAIGMLMAPEKGADMRKKIGDTANGLASDVTDLVVSGKEKIMEVANSISRESHGLVNDISKRAERVKEGLS